MLETIKSKSQLKFQKNIILEEPKYYYFNKFNKYYRKFFNKDLID